VAGHSGQFTLGGYLSTVIHTTLAGIEPTTGFRLLVWRATSRATELYTLHRFIVFIVVISWTQIELNVWALDRMSAGRRCEVTSYHIEKTRTTWRTSLPWHDRAPAGDVTGTFTDRRLFERNELCIKGLQKLDSRGRPCPLGCGGVHP